MKELKKGEFYGNHYQKSSFDNGIITDTKYTHKKVDWHYHENPYFTYLIEGKLFEANKKESYYLKPGSLLFHNWQDAHYNIKPDEYTRGFHIELNKNWFDKYELNGNNVEGSIKLENPIIKGTFNRIFIESKVNDTFSKLSIDSSLVEIFNTIERPHFTKKDKQPAWVSTLRDFLMDDHIAPSLTELGALLQIHPVHLSREFSTYFGVTLGQYCRLLKLNKAISLINTRKFSMTEVCYNCGFYDQSHFIKTFKNYFGYTPLKVLKMLQC